MCRRCQWARDVSPLYRRYHDEEWGVPSFDDRHLFEMLILEGAQAGLSWATILNKREHYRHAFENFDAERMAAFDAPKVGALLQDTGIVRNRRKIEAAINNARRFLEVRAEWGRFSDFIWQFVEGRPIQNAWSSMAEVPVNTPVSDAMSRALRRRGFKFVGSTICYAYMQAVGMVNDHTTDCFRHAQIRRLGE